LRSGMAFFPCAVGHGCQVSSDDTVAPDLDALRNVLNLRCTRFFLKLAPRLLVLRGMSVLRTVSLIVGAALVALGGSAVALFL
jgi:hypothetical protein